MGSQGPSLEGAIFKKSSILKIFPKKKTKPSLLGLRKPDKSNLENRIERDLKK